MEFTVKISVFGDVADLTRRALAGESAASLNAYIGQQVDAAVAAAGNN